MTQDPDDVVAAARVHLLRPGAVTDRWHGVAVDRDGDELVARFRWRRLPPVFQVRLGLEELDVGPWTGVPVETPQDWAYEVSGRLMEECDTGGVAWWQRCERDGDLELRWLALRVNALPQDRQPAYYVSTWSLGAADFVGEHGLDAQPAVEAAAQDRLLAWWCVYVNDPQGLPYVAQLVVTREGAGARLQHLEVAPDVPDSLVTELVYLACFDAACTGVDLIETDLDHPAIRQVPGLLRNANGSLVWTAEGPMLGPPDVTPATVPWTWECDDDPASMAYYLLSDDLQRVVAYGEQHPDDYGGVRFVGDHLEIAFTDPDAHRDRVRDLLEHPDLVDVVRAAHAERHLHAVSAAVMRVLEEHRGNWNGVGVFDGHVEVQLRPRGLDLAEGIWQEHGDAVRITVAGQPYPLDEGAVAAEQRPPGPEQTEPWPEGLEVDLRLEQTSTPTGDIVRGRLALRATTHPVAFDSDQPLDGELLDDAGRRVTSRDGMNIGTGRDWCLRPGEQGEVALMTRTDAARLSDGPYLSAGVWQLVIPIPVHRETPTGLVTTHIIAGPFSVTLTPRAPDPAH